MKSNFIYLNVPGLLGRYENPSPDWKEKVLTFSNAQLEFFSRNGLLRKTPSYRNIPIEEAVLWFDDLTPEGQRFVMTQAVERWLASCDKKGTLASYRDTSKLEGDLARFRKA